MKCLVCKNDRTEAGTTVMPIERGAKIMLITDIPAQVCTNCGEPYLSEATAREVEQVAQEMLEGTISLVTARKGKHTVLIAEYA